MKAALRLLAALPTWLFAVPTLIATLAFDLLTWPMVRKRDSAVGIEPANRNASILILNWNGVEFLREILPSVRIAVDQAREFGDHEVLVIDNGSDDDSVAFVEREHDWARVVRLDTNRHFIRGNRAGVQSVGADKAILVFLNNDMVVEPEFLSELLRPFATGGESGAATPAVDLFATTARIEMVSEDAVETGRTRAFYKRGSLRQEQIALGDRATLSAEPALWAGGGSSAFDRQKFEALAGFDELYVPCYMEDVDLGYRAWKRGWRIEFVPTAIVHHAHRGTANRVFGTRGIEALDRRNRELFFWRNITELGWLVSHALHMPWNAYKDARRRSNAAGGGLGLQYLALLRAILRLPAALAGRVRVRTVARRRDRDVLSASGKQHAD